MRDFGVYIHVPFCAVRCGYCDFNTYAPGEGEFSSREDYVGAALGEMAMAREAMAGDPRPASTVFLGGGTPTMLDAEALTALLDGVRGTWGLAADAEGYDMIGAIHAAGKRVDAWTIREITPTTLTQIDRLLALKVDQITTDDPEGLSMALRA